ncbi:hypothetical protein V499_02046 [Pseudogymnoascus sp. VKM F-103]|nr:hypothetical protein V499_02046 [Pseudogymnoascus sp. VKM F-103]
MGISMAAARKEAVQDASKREGDTRPSTGDSTNGGNNHDSKKPPPTTASAPTRNRIPAQLQQKGVTGKCQYELYSTNPRADNGKIWPAFLKY